MKSCIANALWLSHWEGNEHSRLHWNKKSLGYSEIMKQWGLMESSTQPVQSRSLPGCATECALMIITGCTAAAGHPNSQPHAGDPYVLTAPINGALPSTQQYLLLLFVCLLCPSSDLALLIEAVAIRALHLYLWLKPSPIPTPCFPLALPCFFLTESLSLGVIQSLLLQVFSCP